MTNSAFTKARANLKYTAFIELNQKAVVMYSDDNIKLYKGMRVMGVMYDVLNSIAVDSILSKARA